MMREGRILRGLEGSFPLAPRCLHLCEDIAVLGAPFLIMEYRSGIVIGAELPAGSAGQEKTGQALSHMLVEVLCSLHAVDPDAAGLGALGRPEGFLARTAQGWAKRAELAWEGAAPPAVQEILAWLDRNPVCEAAPATTAGGGRSSGIVAPSCPNPRTASTGCGCWRVA